jgi:hypothetical protein
LFTKSKKSNGAGSSEPTPDDKPTQTPSGETPKTNPTNKKPLPPEYVVPSWLSTTEKIKIFQDWLDVNYPKWLGGKSLNKKSGYGNLGSNTKSAWDSYGTQYANSQRVIITKAKFKVGQFVTAKNNLNASAVMLRNGKYMTTDGSGTALPTKIYKATADLGFIKDILANGNVVLTVPLEIGATYGTRIYTDILVRPSDIQ